MATSVFGELLPSSVDLLCPLKSCILEKLWLLMLGYGNGRRTPLGDVTGATPPSPLPHQHFAPLPLRATPIAHQIIRFGASTQGQNRVVLEDKYIDDATHTGVTFGLYPLRNCRTVLCPFTTKLWPQRPKKSIKKLRRGINIMILINDTCLP